MEEDFKVKAPELYEAPYYTLPQFPPENPYERKGFAFDPSDANLGKFRNTIRAMRLIKERGGDENLRMGGVMNALVAINKKYDYIDPHEAYREFFGGDIPLDQAESELESIYAATEGSKDALGEFQKLDKAQQDEIVREQSPNAKKRMPVYDSMGLPIANPVRDNPDYDSEKERADYEAKLDKKNTWEGYLRIRNAFSPEIVRDAMRFKTAFDSRSEAADAYIDRFIEKGNEYREAFISAVSLLSPELKAGFWDRVKSRVGDSYTDTYQNIIDAFIAPKSEGRRVYALAEEKGFIDENGNLSKDPKKISELQWEYENAFGLNNLGAGIAGNIFARKNTDVKKLFDEGRRQFDRRRNYRLLRDLNRNEFSYSDGEWRTFEDALVNGEYTLRSLLLGFGVGFATKNPHAAIASTSAMMYATEAGDMYADLRFNGKVKESDAANIAATYGAMATALEQLQVSRFAGFFRKNAAIPKSWREYINLGLKEGFKEYALASADETAIEVAQSTAAFAAKKWAVANADATYEQRELWEEYLESAESAIKTMPIITGGMYGAGFPFRARAYMGKMGASVMSGTKAYFRPSKVLENNTRAAGTMAEADKYFNSLIEKLGQAPEDREWLYSYYSAKTDEERSGLLAERFSDESERDEATLILQEYENFDREATREFFKSKAEIARKLKEDDQKLLNGDTTDISVLDETDENGRYVVLESAIDAFGMRDNVIFADTAEELAKVSGLSLEAAEEQMARGGAKGFYESGSGNIVVIRRHFSDGADALRTFAHEYGHRIMAKIREGDIGGYNRMCDDVLSIVGGERMAREILPASYSEAGSAQYLKDARAVAEEVLMRAAERVATKKVLDARNRGIWARFKRWFKGLFEEKSLADIADENLAQIALDVLQRERRFDVKLSERSPKTSRNWRAKTPEINGAEVSGEWAIMDAGKLLASTDEGYDDRLQPRNRARQASKEQTNEIALNLDPARLNDSETTDLGAPIVDARGMVISGNGRTIAIRQAYGSERAERGDAYREFVYNRAKELGIDIPDGVKNPVLVRRVDNTGEMSMEEFAARSNKSQVAGMSVAEQAIADSRRILEADLLDIFFPDAGGNVLAASNADFYNAFLNLVGGGEAYRNRDGSVRQNLSPRIRAAVLAAMLNPERRETVERLLDNPEGYNALINGLMQSAANLAELANKPEYDLSGELSQAVELFVETRDKGQTVDEFAAQTDMFRDAPSAETMFLMRLFEENAKSSGGISGVLRQYAAECKKIDTTTQSLFGEENPTKLEKLEEAYRHYAADLSNEAGNGNLRWRDTGEPAAEEISEAQKQYEEVKSKYMGTPLWMKAPNGKRTNLTEEQWVRVRTPNFKKWFGDWEKEAWAKAAMDFLERTAPVANLTGQEFQKDGVKLTDKVPAYFKSIGNVARNDELGDVVLDLKGVEDSIAHGVGRLKSAAFMAVPDVIEKGFIFNREENWKERGWNTAVIVAPIKLGEDDYVCEVVVKKVRGQQRFYLHEVEIKKTLDGVFKSVANNGNASQVSKLILGKHLAEVKGNVSQVVDENGEPLVVYHGTPKFDRFSIFKKGSGGYLGPAIYFTNLKTYAQKYENKWGDGGNLYDVFISLKRPLIVKSVNPAKEILKTIYGKDSVYDRRSQKQSYDTKILSSADIKKLQSKGYDGVIWEYGGSKEYAVYDSSKIKSATDNIGTYSENPDIRWREVSEPSPEEIAEANRQKADVKAKWSNPDGSMKKGYMLAPNGKHTNLTEDQWLQVRTPNFKKWFGDWEKEAWTKAAMDFLERTAPVANLTGQEFQKDGVRLTDKVSAYFNSIGNVAHNEELGDVILNLEGIKDSIAHGIGRLKASAFMAVKDVIENGFIFNRETNWKNRNYDSAVIVAPISINNTDYICEAVITRRPNENRFYLHEVEIKETLEKAFKTPTEGRASQASKLIIGKHIAEVKGNVSKVVDENGEPMVVYHGSTAMFNEFRSKFIGHSTGTADGRGFYFTTDKSYAEGFKSKDGRVIEAFLNIRDLLDYKKKTITKAALKKIIKEIDRAEFEADGEHYFISNFGNYYDEGIDKVIDEATESNYDFCDTDVEIFNVLITSGADFDLTAKAIKNVTGKDGEIVPKDNNTTHFIIFNSNQAKSATDNIGTFNTNNSDIRWREVSEPIKQKFSSGNTSLRQIAAGFKKIDFKPGSTNFDLGGGKFDEGTKYLETKGVKNFVFDPVNRDSKTNKEAFEIVKNGGFDTTTCNNVLNVISEANVRDNIILQAAKSLRPNGTAYFTVYEGDGSGKGRQSQKDSWQEHRKTVDYLGEIKKHFGDVSLKNKVITARKPILLNEKASWFMDDSFENPVRWKDDADISDISAKVKKIIDSISDKKNKHIEVLRKISDTEADFLLKKTGLDLKGYSHSIDNYSILHILKKHGSEKELQRGQIPVTIKDIQNFPTIVSDYDDVKYAGKSKIGRDTIRFEKNIGDNLVLVFEEMRIGKKLLALSTMYIQKRKKLTSNANASSNTSETLSTSSDFQESANTPENQENNSRLKALLRQERSENPVIWASIVLAREILLGRAITSARLDRVLPPERFDGTKREYAVNRAREIAERYRADKEKFGNDLNLGVQRAENDLYWTRDVVEEMYASFRRDGEEYGIARQRLMEWLKERRRRDLETVKGLSSEELGIDVPAAIEDALEKEPERRKPGENAAEESGEETFEASGEGIDAEIESAREKPAPSSIRDIIGKIRAGVTKAAKARGMDEAARRRAYRNTLAEVLRESARRLTYGREREAIMKKISDLSAKGYSVIKIKDGERAGQKIDNYTLRAEHIALRIFNRGVRDTKRELSEKFEKIVSRKGKKPSRMERDDKRALAGAVQMRVYNIKRYSEMDAAELEAEYSATVDRLENVEKNFAEDAGKGEVRSDIEDIRAEVANAVHDMKMFGNWRDKSRAQMAEGVEFLEKYIDEETEEQKARVEARKEENARRRNVFIAALRQSKRNANKDGELRKLFRGIVNNTLPFDSILSILGEAATGKTYAEFKSLSNEIVSKVNRAAENVSNECFAKKEKLYAILRECYGEDQSTALRRLLKADAKYERFSKNPETPNPMTLSNVMQLYATALQTNYQRNIFEHRIRKSEEYEKIQKRIDEIELKFPGKESKSGAEWKIASEEIETLERERDAIIANSVSDYISELEGVLTEADKNFVTALRAEYAEALPALSAVSRRVIGLPIEQADELYMPVKVDYGGGLGEGTGGVPVVPKSLSPRVSHLRDFDETADPITLYLERVKENAQFKYFSELYIELRGIFADESLQKLIRERCGADVLKLLKESIADICTGETKGFNLKAARQASGLFAIAQLGWNFGSGVRQFLPGIFSWGAYIGTPAVLRNCASFFTPEGFRAALEIAHSETGRRRFAVGNMQIIEEMLEKPDQNRFWRLYKRYALIFNRSSDMLAIMFVGQGVYRSGVESYLKKGFSEAEAKRLAMSDMWQIAERSQASGKIQNMSAWQRRGGDLAKAIGMFSSPPQLMFAKATQDMRRAIALGIKTPEGRAAAWNAVKTLFTVSVLVEGSYAASTVLWNALLKGYFDDDDDEYILKSMITGPFGGLFLFGRLVDSLGTGYSPSAIPMEGLARPAQYTIELVKDIAVFDWDEAIKDLDKLASSAFSPWRDLRKILKDKKK